VVIAAHIPTVVTSRYPRSSRKLRSLDIFSAWRLLPDVQVGIVHVKSEQKLDVVVALMSRRTTARVGVSGGLRGSARDATSPACGKNDVAGPTTPHPRSLCSTRSILATAAVSAPEAMIKRSAQCWTVLATLPDCERKMLFGNGFVWQDNDGVGARCG